MASRARARRSRHSPSAQVPADLLTASMTPRVLVMVSAAGRSERESAAKALICADMSSIPGSFREAARSVSRAFRSFASSSIPAALVVRTRTLMSSSRARHASEKDDVAESKARLLAPGPRRSA